MFIEIGEGRTTDDGRRAMVYWFALRQGWVLWDKFANLSYMFWGRKLEMLKLLSMGLV